MLIFKAWRFQQLKSSVSVETKTRLSTFWKCWNFLSNWYTYTPQDFLDMLRLKPRPRNNCWDHQTCKDLLDSWEFGQYFFGLVFLTVNTYRYSQKVSFSVLISIICWALHAFEFYVSKIVKTFSTTSTFDRDLEW